MSVVNPSPINKCWDEIHLLIACVWWEWNSDCIHGDVLFGNHKTLSSSYLSCNPKPLQKVVDDMGLSLSNQMCFGQYNYPNLYVGEILLPRLLATTIFTQARLPWWVEVLGWFKITHSIKSMWHHLHCNMIPSVHKLLIAEYSRIFIQVPWNYYKPTPWNHSAIF